MSCLEACGRLPSRPSRVQSEQQVVGFNGFKFNAARFELNCRRDKLIWKRLRWIYDRIVSGWRRFYLGVCQGIDGKVRYLSVVSLPRRWRMRSLWGISLHLNMKLIIYGQRGDATLRFVQIKVTSYLSDVFLLFFLIVPSLRASWIIYDFSYLEKPAQVFIKYQKIKCCNKIFEINQFSSSK